jgi:hypothetical protein
MMCQAGASGSLRPGVTREPVKLTCAVQALKTRDTCGRSPACIWPGGGIILMLDVTQTPENAFGYLPTPALVAPMQLTLPREGYRVLGGHDEAQRSGLRPCLTTACPRYPPAAMRLSRWAYPQPHGRADRGRGQRQRRVTLNRLPVPQTRPSVTPHS